MRPSIHEIFGAVLATVCAATPPAYIGARAQDGGGGQVVVRASTRDGQPVLDLKLGDVTVRIDGTEREVKGLELVRPAAGGAATPAGAPSPAPSMLAAPYATNATAPAGPKGSREILLVIDDEGIGIGREEMVRDAITRLVAALAPGDRVGIMAMKQGGVSIAPTAHHAAVTEALSKIVATGSPSESAINLACRSKVMLGTLGGLLRDAPPERTVVFFSPGMSPITDEIRSQLGKAADNSLCQIRTNDLEELGKASSGSAAEMFIVYHSEGMANPANLTNAQAGLENVAGTSGAEMLRLTGDGETVANRVATTAGFYYVASLEGGSTTGARRFEARVNRDDVRVSARPLTTPSAATAEKAGSPREMLRVATVYRDLPLRAAGFVSRQHGAKDLKVVALFEPDDPTLKLTAAMIGLFDEKGTLKAQWTAQANELGRAPVIAALTVAPGNYRMRVAASDSSGKGGTTDYELPVRLPEAPPVQTSDMLLGVSQGGFAPKLAFTPADAAAIGFIEIYGVQKDAQLDVTFEIVNGSEVMGSGQGTVGAGPSEDARIAYGGFGIATLAPGDYTMRATIKVDGKQAGVATRTLRKLK